mgnify:CR=1 FL=1
MAQQGKGTGDEGLTCDRGGTKVDGRGWGTNWLQGEDAFRVISNGAGKRSTHLLYKGG